jgi:hypothetical protein
MKRYVEGENRSQSTLFPESLEDYIAEDNPVRVVDVSSMSWTSRLWDSRVRSRKRRADRPITPGRCSRSTSTDT